jgi:hypothetical protein
MELFLLFRPGWGRTMSAERYNMYRSMETETQELAKSHPAAGAAVRSTEQGGVDKNDQHQRRQETK